MLLSSTEMSGGGEWRIVMALNAEIVAIAVIGVIRTPVVRIVVIIVTSHGTHADPTVRGKGNIVGVAEEYLTDGGLPMGRGIRTRKRIGIYAGRGRDDGHDLGRLSEVAHFLLFALGKVYRICTEAESEIIRWLAASVGIGAVRMRARKGIVCADGEVGELLGYLGWRGVEDKHVVHDEGIRV